MTPAPAKLPREFYTRSDVLTVARDLLGKLLVVPGPNGERVSGKIVEVEAYRGPEDRASHAYGGRRTKRTETMYGMGGVARSEEHTSELQSRFDLVCRLLLEKKKNN